MWHYQSYATIVKTVSPSRFGLSSRSANTSVLPGLDTQLPEVNLACDSLGESQKESPVPDGRVPARWQIFAGLPGECIGQITNPNMDVSSGQTKVPSA